MGIISLVKARVLGHLVVVMFRRVLFRFACFQVNIFDFHVNSDETNLQRQRPSLFYVRIIEWEFDLGIFPDSEGPPIDLLTSAAPLAPLPESWRRKKINTWQTQSLWRYIRIKRFKVSTWTLVEAWKLDLLPDTLPRAHLPI